MPPCRPPPPITSSGKPVVDIRVTAFQWGWRFDYPDLNVGVAGETTNGPNNHGPQMVVPVGQTVQITLVSDDVIHGFYVRDFNFSRYALPGVTNLLRPQRAPRRHLQRAVHPDLRALSFGDAVQRAGGEPVGVRPWAAAEVRAGHTLPALRLRGPEQPTALRPHHPVQCLVIR